MSRYYYGDGKPKEWMEPPAGFAEPSCYPRYRETVQEELDRLDRRWEKLKRDEFDRKWKAAQKKTRRLLLDALFDREVPWR